MANHQARSAQQPPLRPQPEPPRIEWAQIVKVGDKFHLARIVTKGDRIIEQHLGQAETWRPIVEAEYQRWAVEAVLDRNDNL